MTLTARLLVFSLATLGAVLAGFSAALYALADDHLRRQHDRNLLHAADTLAAAVEMEPPGGVRGLEWEWANRYLAVGGEYAWAATAGDGAVLGASGQPGAADLAATARRAAEAGRSHVPFGVAADGQEWRAVHTEYADGPPAPGRHAAIAVTVLAPLAPLDRTLGRLAATLAGLSVAVWTVALLAGRWVCRRALRPLTAMAAAARELPADGRLPVGPAADELAALGVAFNGLLDRLGVAHERQRRFTGEASHQLRTPLAAVLGQVEVALRRDRPADEYRRALAAVHGQAERMRKLVDALLLLARADEDAEPPGRERFDLAAWLPDHLRAWGDHPRAGDLYSDGQGPAWVEAHPVLFGELLNVLIDNALRYSPAGSPVRVRLGGDSAQAWVDVEDAGPGIAAADRAHLFRPFVRGADARRRGTAGMGLGLAIAGRLAALMGGAVTVESEPGRGSVFRVVLPAGNEKPPASR